MKRLVAGTFFISVVGLGAPALADSGGPDAGGYTWADVYEINGPIYDPQGATFGTALTLGDDDSQLVTLPFSFDWYGSTYTSAYINSNGVLSFSAPQEDTTLVLCGSGTPVPIAAPWWIDILPANNGSIRYDTHGATGTRIFVAQWLEVENYPSSTGFATFEVQLHEIDDHVEFHYEDVTFSVTASDYGADGFVGVAGNGITTQISCDTTILGNGYAIGIYPGGGTVCVDLDGDGFEDDACGGTDCNDTNANINPGMNEVCDGVDNDCDFLVDEGFDVDNDGWSTCGGDCNDSSSNVNPGLSESCFDGVDNDCDGWTDSADSECAGMTTTPPRAMTTTPPRAMTTTPPRATTTTPPRAMTTTPPRATTTTPPRAMTTTPPRAMTTTRATTTTARPPEMMTTTPAVVVVEGAAGPPAPRLERRDSARAGCCWWRGVCSGGDACTDRHGQATELIESLAVPVGAPFAARTRGGVFAALMPARSYLGSSIPLSLRRAWASS